MSRIRLVLAVVVCACVTVSAPAAAAPLVLSPPTDAPVLDPFRLPDGPYGAGNRGIEYDTADGDRVHAAADGVVAFAGAVAGSLFVSVDHPGGLRTTYGFVGRVLVRRGAPVERGDLVALAEGPFHFTVRLHGDYVDPAAHFGRARTRVRLIPHRPVTLRDGPFGSRTVQLGIDGITGSVHSPGRLGVPHGHATGKEVPPWQSSP